MKSRTLTQIRNAGNLNPSTINDNMQGIALDVADAQSQRWCYSQFVLDFTGVANTDAQALRGYTITAPWSFEIVGVELTGYFTSSVVATLSCNATGWANVTVTGAGSTTRARSEANFQASCPVGSSYAFEVSFSGATTPSSLKAVISIRTDRFNAGDTLTTYSPGRVRVGQTDSAATLNSEFAAIASAVTSDTAADKQPRIEVFSRRNATSLPASDVDFTIPSSSRRLAAGDVLIVAASTEATTWTYKDSSGSTVTSREVQGDGATSTAYDIFTTGLPATQTLNAPTTPGSDGKLSVSQTLGSGTIPLAYCVLYWT